MSFFITDALAQATPAPTPESGLLSFLPLIIIFAVFYFLLIRPQMKRAKEHKNMVAALPKDHDIVTSGGLLGRITDVNDDFVTLEVADGVALKVQTHALATILPKGTIKAA